MSEYVSRVVWKRDNQNFLDNGFSRGHVWQFDGGAEVPASSSPQILPAPYSVPEGVDPEEAFVAALFSCHMLFFLAIAASRGFIVDAYTDNAVGVMEKDSDGNLAMTRVTLRPRVTFSGDNEPSMDQLERMQHRSHERCFLANSVKTGVVTEIPA